MQTRRYLGGSLGSLGPGGVLLSAVGLLILLFGAAALLVPRARFVGSTPAPNVSVTVPPSRVRITFDRELHPTSYALVWRTEPGNTRRVDRARGLDPDDAGRRTLEVALESGLPGGLYEVRWHARTRVLSFTPWGTEGSFHFGVGVPVPPHLTAHQWDEGALDPGTLIDARLHVLFVGVVCVVLGLASPWIRRRLKV